MKATDQGIEYYIGIAQQHGAHSDPDHEVGDLQAFLREAWAVLSEAQRRAFQVRSGVCEVVSPVEFMSIAGEGSAEVLICPYTGRIEAGEILVEGGSRAAWVDLQTLRCAAAIGDSGRVRLGDVRLINIAGNPVGLRCSAAPTL